MDPGLNETSTVGVYICHSEVLVFNDYMKLEINLPDQHSCIMLWIWNPFKEESCSNWQLYRSKYYLQPRCVVNVRLMLISLTIVEVSSYWSPFVEHPLFCVSTSRLCCDRMFLKTSEKCINLTDILFKYPDVAFNFNYITGINTLVFIGNVWRHFTSVYQSIKGFLHSMI